MRAILSFHVLYVIGYKNPLGIIVPNACTPQLDMCNMSADLEMTYLYFCQLKALLS